LQTRFYKTKFKKKRLQTSDISTFFKNKIKTTTFTFELKKNVGKIERDLQTRFYETKFKKKRLQTLITTTSQTVRHHTSACCGFAKGPVVNVFHRKFYNKSE